MSMPYFLSRRLLFEFWTVCLLPSNFFFPFFVCFILWYAKWLIRCFLSSSERVITMRGIGFSSEMGVALHSSHGYNHFFTPVFCITVHDDRKKQSLSIYITHYCWMVAVAQSLPFSQTLCCWAQNCDHFVSIITIHSRADYKIAIIDYKFAILI